MIDDKEVKLEIQRVKSGDVRNWGFLKGTSGDHGFVVTKKPISGDVVTGLQEQSGNKGKPVKGKARYDEKEEMVVFETAASPGSLLTLFKETFRKRKIALSKFDVRQVEGLDAEPGEGGEGATPAPDEANAGVGVAFTQSRLAWDAARKRAEAEIKKLKSSIVETCEEEEDADFIRANVATFDRILETLDTRLIDHLDAGLQAAPAERPRHNQAALAVVQEYKTFLTTDPLMQEIDANPFVGVAVAKTLLDTVLVLEKKLQ